MGALDLEIVERYPQDTGALLYQTFAVGDLIVYGAGGVPHFDMTIGGTNNALILDVREWTHLRATVEWQSGWTNPPTDILAMGVPYTTDSPIHFLPYFPVGTWGFAYWQAPLPFVNPNEKITVALPDSPDPYLAIGFKRLAGGGSPNLGLELYGCRVGRGRGYAA